jgi:hypothetical protein
MKVFPLPAVILEIASIVPSSILIFAQARPRFRRSGPLGRLA